MRKQRADRLPVGRMILVVTMEAKERIGRAKGRQPKKIRRP